MSERDYNISHEHDTESGANCTTCHSGLPREIEAPNPPSKGRA